MAQVLIDYSRHKQVLLFTCHPETRDTVLEVEPLTPVLEVVPVDPVAPAEQPAIRQGILDLNPNAPSYETGAQIGADETVKMILAALDARPMALSEIAAHTQLDEARCTVLLRQLRAAGRVDVTGHARGARWHRIRAAES